MTQRIRALVLVPFMFLALSIPPALKTIQPHPVDEDINPAFALIEDGASTAVYESALIEPSIEPTLIPFIPLEDAETVQETVLPEFFTPEPVFLEESQEQSRVENLVTSEEDKTRQLEVFSELWAIVNEIYLYPDFNGLDWLETRRRVIARIELGMSFEEFYREMEKLVRSLGDEHSFFLTPEKVAAQEAKYAGNLDFAGIGVILKPVVEKDRSVILLTFPGGPADLAGLKSRDSILAVDGVPILDENGAARDLIRGPEGTEIVLTVQSPGGEIRPVNVRRDRISGPIPIPTSILTSIDGKRIGYMLLVSFADSTVESRIGQALMDMSIGGPLDGLIIDNRFNEGGADRVLKGALSYFTGGLLGHFISRKTDTALEVTAVDINGSQQLPLVVIVSSATVSYGEVFSGLLQDSGRAVLLGEPTRGNVETLSGHNFPDGSRAWIAYKSFKPLNNPDIDWEKNGVIPDMITSSEWEEHALENDPAVLAALNIMNAGKIITFHP
jgi:carboxyl-terminal processing protease